MATVEELAFLERIRERPTDDGPRLIFADWLDEHNDSRGEFIRIQCALARLAYDDPQRLALEEREQKLREKEEAEWTRPLRGLASGWAFHRGLVEWVTIDAAVFMARAAELFQVAPIRRVRFLDAAACFEALMDCPFLAKLPEIDLCANELGNGGLNVLSRSRYLTELEVLHLGFNALTDRGLEVLAKIPALVRLRELHLNDNPGLGTPGIRALAESPYLTGLETLDISGNRLSDSALRILINSRSMPHLDRLALTGNSFGDSGIEAFANSALLERMLRRSSELDLCRNSIGPLGARALAESPLMELVTVLDLSENALGDAGLSILAQSPYLVRLRTLSLRFNRIGDPGVRALAQSRLPEWLERLDLIGNFVTADSVRALSEATMALNWWKQIDVRADAGLHLRAGRR